MLEKITIKDSFRIHKLAHAIWPSAFKDILTKAQIDFMLNWMYAVETLQKQIASAHIFYIYKIDNVDTAFIGIELNYKNTNKLRIHKIYVLPNAQNKGVGKKMIDFITAKYALPNKQTHLNLNVNKYNKAVSFYKYLGFEIVKEEDIDTGNGFFMNDFVMEKCLIRQCDNY